MTNYPNKKLFLSFPGSKDISKYFSTEGKQFFAKLIWRLPNDIEHCIHVLENHCENLMKQNPVKGSAASELSSTFDQIDGLHRNLRNISIVECFMFRHTICQLAIILYRTKFSKDNCDKCKSIMCRNITKCVQDAEQCTQEMLLFRILYKAFEIYFYDGPPNISFHQDLLGHLKLTIKTIIHFGYCRKELLKLIQIAIQMERKLYGSSAAKLLESRLKLEYTLRFTQYPKRKEAIASATKHLFKQLENVDTMTEIHYIGNFVQLLHPRDVLENTTLQEWIFKYQRHAPGISKEFEEVLETSEKLVVLTIINERYQTDSRSDIRSQIEKILLPKGTERQYRLIKKFLGSPRESIARSLAKIRTQDVDLSIIKPNVKRKSHTSEDSDDSINEKIAVDSLIRKIENRISKILEYMTIINETDCLKRKDLSREERVKKRSKFDESETF